MSTRADILPISAIKNQSLVDEKAPALVEVFPATHDDIQTLASTLTTPLEPRSVTSFKLEDHPIDVVHKIRVYAKSISNFRAFLTVL